jgi:RNA polymerase sigma-70 factor (ECF subfamily)
MRKLYAESEAESFGISLEDFARALSRTDEPGKLYLKDLALALACSRGVVRAWEVFEQRYRDRLYRAALVIARFDSVARELADSLYGEIFVSRNGERRSKLASYTGRGPLEAWLRAVLSQTYVDRYRSRRRTVSLEDRLDSLPLFSYAVSSVDPRLNAAIKEAFVQLPGEQRYLLASYFFDQRTFAEIGRTIGVHESTAKRRTDRLIRFLRGRISRLLREKGMSVREVQESLRTDVRELTIDLGSRLVEE